MDDAQSQEYLKAPSSASPFLHSFPNGKYQVAIQDILISLLQTNSPGSVKANPLRRCPSTQQRHDLTSHRGQTGWRSLDLMVTKSPSCGACPSWEGRLKDLPSRWYRMEDERFGSQRWLWGNNWKKDSSHPHGSLNAVRKRKGWCGGHKDFMWILGNSFYFLFNNNVLLAGKFRSPGERGASSILTWFLVFLF